jgi:hypothetical protein
MFWVYDSSMRALLAAARSIIRRARDGVNAHRRGKQMRAEIAWRRSTTSLPIIYALLIVGTTRAAEARGR